MLKGLSEPTFGTLNFVGSPVGILLNHPPSLKLSLISLGILLSGGEPEGGTSLSAHSPTPPALPRFLVLRPRNRDRSCRLLLPLRLVRRLRKTSPLFQCSPPFSEGLQVFVLPQSGITLQPPRK